MDCYECGKLAVVHATELRDGAPVEAHYCDEHRHLAGGLRGTLYEMPVDVAQDDLGRDIERAIAAVERSRETHIVWFRWLTHYPAEAVKNAGWAGDAEHHRSCIVRYDHVLATLRRCRELAGRSGDPCGSGPTPLP
jgi:hypothetical protein